MLTRILKYIHWRFGLFINAMDKEAQCHNEASIKFTQLMTANNKEVFEQMYSDPQLLRHYLVNERLEFYNQVSQKVDANFDGNKRDATCVDVGCGTGHLLLALRKQGFMGRLIGLDTAESAQQQVLGHNADLEFYPGYLSEQGWDNYFDLILCTEVLEHCDDPVNIVQDMLRAIKPNGMIVITVPDGRKDTWDGHIHFWSPESFKLFINSFQKPVNFDYFDNTNLCIIRS